MGAYDPGVTSDASPIRRPGGVPILGDYLAFRRDRLGFWTEVGRLGPVVRVRFGSQEFWVVTDPEVVEHLLLGAVKDYPRDRRLMALNRGPGPELMFNTDRWEEWRRRRRLLSPAFHRHSIARFGHTMVAHAVRAAEEWRADGRIDLQARLRTMTMRAILETMFSVVEDSEVARLQQSFEVSSRVVSGRAAAPVPIPWWLPSPANLRLRRLTRYRWRVLYGIVRERIDAGSPRGDLLDLLIAQHVEEQRLGVADLVGEMSGIVFAGHETTAETTTWLLYLLSTHPEVEERLRAEMATVLGDRDPTVEDLDRMPYLDQVVQETLRLYPPVFLTIREADVEHRVGGLPIPAGTRLVVNIRGLHHDPVAWPDPERFLPDRFGPGAAAGRHRFQFIPFLAGPKKCLGDHFAMLEMRLVVPTLLRRLRLGYAGDRPPRPRAGFTLSVDGGMPMEVAAIRSRS